jgi:hypothetical protein
MITETGWMSREKFGGDLAALNGVWTGSEQEQVEYLNRLQQLVKDTNMLFVNWAFMHDYSMWVEGDIPTALPLFDSIGLRNYDGTEKMVWKEWRELVELN